MGKSGKKGGKRLKKKDLCKLLTDLFQFHPEEVYPIKSIFKTLKLETHPEKMLCMDLLEELAFDGYIKETAPLKYALNTQGQVFEGTFNRKANGKNSVTPAEGGEPVFIAERNSLHAMNGDLVKVSLLAKKKHQPREAQVIEILKRSDKTFVGRLEVRKDFAFLQTEDRTLANDIFIPTRSLKGGKNGDKAVVKITEWPDNAKNPIGKVIDIPVKGSAESEAEFSVDKDYGHLSLLLNTSGHVKVWINGKEVHSAPERRTKTYNQYNLSHFTGYLRPGKNMIKVSVDNNTAKDTILDFGLKAF